MVTERPRQFQSLSIGVWVRAGTRHEAPSETGISHFLEHMMFKGTRKRSAAEIAESIDRVGGDFNAFTSREYTCFHVLTLARDLKLAADILSDVLLESRFDAGEIVSETKVILQEISMIEDNPEEYVHDLFFEKAFGSHPLGKPILGNQKTVSSFDRKAVVSYFRRRYSPRNMVISVCGDVGHGEVVTLLNRHFGQIRAQAPVSTSVSRLARSARSGVYSERVGPLTVRASGAKHVRRALEQTHFVLGFPGLPHRHPRRYAMHLLNTRLGGGMSSALFQEIRERKGLAYSVYSAHSPFSDCGLLTIYAGTAPEDASTCLDIAGRELVRLRKRPLDRGTLRSLKENIKGTLLLASDSVENRMMSNARDEMFLRGHVSVGEICEAVGAVTAREIQDLASALFDPRRMILVTIGPQRGSAGLQNDVARRLE